VAAARGTRAGLPAAASTAAGSGDGGLQREAAPAAGACAASSARASLVLPAGQVGRRA